MYQYFFSLDKKYIVTFFALIPVFAFIGAYSVSLSSILKLISLIFLGLYLVTLFHHFVLEKWQPSDPVESFPYARKFPMANIIVHSLYIGWIIGFILYMQVMI